MKRLLIAAGLMGTLALTASADPFWNATFTAPGANLSAAPGATTGWGFTLQNLDASRWLVPYNLDADTFEHGTPNSLFLFPIVAPGASVTVPYGGTDGLYAFTWDATAPLGFQNIGVFVISADWYTGDPFSGGTFDTSAGVSELAYSITAAGGSTGVPEPEAAVVLVLVMGSVLLLARRHRVPG